MQKQNLTIGYSPCPNDTFIFYALAHNKVQSENVIFAPPFLDDVESLNHWALQGKLDVTKLSFHALGHALDNYIMLSAGAALGRGCGPLLVVRRGGVLDSSRARIAIPGRYTTAAMLLKLYAPQCENVLVMRFEEIISAIRQGIVDGGVIIHESRFTYQDFGLECVQDLGEWWENETGLPIPLGCIAARRTFSKEMLGEIDMIVKKSLEWAHDHPEQCMDYIRSHAQEMSDDVLHNHIDLYVNDFSTHIAEEGKRAVEELFRRGRAAGIFSDRSASRWSLDT